MICTNEHWYRINKHLSAECGVKVWRCIRCGGITAMDRHERKRKRERERLAAFAKQNQLIVEWYHRHRKIGCSCDAVALSDCKVDKVMGRECKCHE